MMLAVRLAPCRCGYEWDASDLVDVTALGSAHTTYVAGRPCPTPGCRPWCPVCRRPEADIHSGACSSIVLSKLVDPTRISREDCV